MPLVGEQRGCASGWQSPDSWGPLVEEHRGASADWQLPGSWVASLQDTLVPGTASPRLGGGPTVVTDDNCPAAMRPAAATAPAAAVGV